MHTDIHQFESLCRLPRPDLELRLAALFPDSAPTRPAEAGSQAAFRGGRTAAETALAAIDPVAYARSRNHVGGAVTRLSPWIRHGVLSLAEVRDAALARVARAEEAEKLVSELAWREYWRLVHAALGRRIHDDIEPPAVIPRHATRATAVPDDVLAARTGMRCVDAFVRRLHETGWLHNHERMWLASWLVHVKGVRWQAGADWFLQHLLDGDPASNHLSWQWVAGTFSVRPYIFNRENLEEFTGGTHCGPCPLLGRCDVEGTYDDLSARLFAGEAAGRPTLRIRPAAGMAGCGATPARPLVWLTMDAVSARSPAATAWPDAPRLFVIDPGWLAAERPALKRLVFLFECLADVPGIHIEFGDPAEIVPAQARALGCDGVAIADTPCPRVRSTAALISRTLPLAVHEWPPLCDRSRVDDLGRFSRYWQRVRASALRPTSAG